MAVTVRTSYSVAIVGLGNIGYRLDRRKTAASVQSHYQGFISLPNFYIKFGFDTDEGKRNEFTAETGIPAYERVLSGHVADVIVLAGGADTRLGSLHDALELMNPSVILCEKPLIKTTYELAEVKKLLSRYKTPIFLNYFRRALPEFQRLKKLLTKDDYGEVLKCSIWYSKGILNSASHFVDLIAWLTDFCDDHTEVRDARMLNSAGDFFLNINGIPCYFLACEEKNFFLNTVEIITNSARIRLDAAGRILEVSEAKSWDANGLKALVSEVDIVRVDFGSAQTFVSRELERFLMEGSCELSAAREHVAVAECLIDLQSLVTDK